MASVDLVYLIDYERLKIGDTNPLSYRYTDAWLRTSLILAVKTLQRYWRDKYLIDPVTQEAYRNTNYLYWLFDEAEGVIESADEPIIVIMASIIILEGSLENSAWDFSSWRDAEISYSNLEGGRIRDANLARLVNELFSLVLPPTKKLARALKASLPGYLNGNDWEREQGTP
jgi:hypothetical protein